MTKALKRVMYVIEQILRVFIIITVALITCQVFSRYVLASPLMWTEQLCRMFFIWMMMLGLPVLFYEKSFMAFDLLLNKFPEKIRSKIQLFIFLGICAFAVFWGVGAVQLILGTLTKYVSGVRIHYYWLYGAQVVSAVLILWVMIEQSVEILRKKPAAEQGKEGEK